MSRKRAHHKGWARSAVLFVICTGCISILASSVSALDWKATQRANNNAINIATTTVNSDSPWGDNNKIQKPSIVQRVKLLFLEFAWRRIVTVSETLPDMNGERIVQPNLTDVGASPVSAQ